MNNGVLAPFVDFARNSAGSYVGADKVLKYAAIDEARWDYDPDTGELIGLLREEAGVNGWVRSAEFDNASWVKSLGTSITADAALAPDGTMTMDKIVGANGTGSRYVRQDVTMTADPWTVSVHGKPADVEWIAILDAIPNAFAYFNVSTGQIGNSLNCTPRIRKRPNGTYRCSITYTGTAATHSPRIYAVTANGSLNLISDGTQGAYIWGAQVEPGDFATSYIPTTNSPGSRAADEITVDLSDFEFNADEGTLFLECVQQVANDGPLLVVDDETTDNFMRLSISSGEPVAEAAEGGSTQMDIAGGSPQPAGVVLKAAIAYKTNDAAAAFNGNVTGDNTFAVPAVTKLTLGHDAVNSAGVYCHFRRLRASRSRRSNAALASDTDNDGLPLYGKTVAFLGDSVTERGNYVSSIASATGCAALNMGIGGTRMGAHDSPNYDEMSGYKIASAIASGDFTALEAAAQAQYEADGDDNRPQAALIAGTDWNTVDVVVIGYGTNDWRGSAPLGTAGSVTPDGSTFRGSLGYILQQIGTAYPHLKFVFVSPTWRLVPNTPLDPDENSDNTPNAAGLYLLEYVDAILDECADREIPAIDTYRAGVFNIDNWAALLSDGVHPTIPAGCIHLAEAVTPFLVDHFA